MKRLIPFVLGCLPIAAQTTISVTQVAVPVAQVPCVTVAAPPVPTGAKAQRLSCIALDPKISIDTTTTPPTLRIAGLPVFIEAETPAGTIDGTNLAFTLASTPGPLVSLRLFRNGIRLTQGSDYTIAANKITFVQGAQPQAGDVLLADYRH